MGLTGRHWRDVQAANDMLDEELQNFARHEGHRYRVSIYGSARKKEGDESYELARALAKTLASNDIDVVTGGGPGIMEAANRGAQEARSRGRSIGNALRLPLEQGSNSYVGHEFVTENFALRLLVFGSLVTQHICIDGGVGTALEFLFFAQHSQIQTQMGMLNVRRQLFPLHPSVEIGYIPKVLTVGKGFEWVDKMLAEMDESGTAPSGELNFIEKTPTLQSAIDTVLKERDLWREHLLAQHISPLN